MNTKSLCQKNSSIITIGLPVLLCAAVLSAVSCNLPGGPDVEKGSLTLFLPETSTQGAASQRASVQNMAAGVSRSVLPDNFTGTLVYKLTLSGPGETQTLEAGGGGTTVSLDAGQWTVEAAAYDPGNPSVTVGSGSAVITVVAGQSSSVRIPMKVDPAYEALLTEIYIHNEAELRRVGTDFAIDGSVSFYLERDIVLEQPWTPIGNPGGLFSPDYEPFRAVFNGQEHSITVRSFSGAKKAGNGVFFGFFASVENAKIKNTTIKYELSGPVDIRTGDGSTYYDSHAGGVAGFADNTSFENVRVTGNFSIIADGDSSLNMGGIVGDVNFGTITNCHVTGNIGGTSTEKALNIGGIAGSSMGPITGSSFTGAVNGSAPSGNGYAGGIAGYIENGNVTSSYVSAQVEGEGFYVYAGGIVGKAVSDSTIEHCYAWVIVDAEGIRDVCVGGIAGSTGAPSSPLPVVTACYALGTVTGSGDTTTTKSAGGIVGSYSGIIEYCAVLNTSISFTGATDIDEVAGMADAFSLGNIQYNYTAADIAGFPGSSGFWSGTSTPRVDFTGPAPGTVYSTANLNWNFAAGTGDWKFISGYDYPVLSWQTTPPPAP
ncbi:MAG: hypothetical protein LBK83_08300 [Treponema sp.]|nr:hypothetical protein [Treponema sp.]